MASSFPAVRRGIGSRSAPYRYSRPSRGLPTQGARPPGDFPERAPRPFRFPGGPVKRPPFGKPFVGDGLPMVPKKFKVPWRMLGREGLEKLLFLELGPLGILGDLALDYWMLSPPVPAQEAGYAPGAGWTLCCDTGIRPLNAWSTVYRGTAHVACEDTAIYCGLAGQVPGGHDGEPVNFAPFGTPRKGSFTLFLGPYNYVIGDRFQIAQYWQCDGGGDGGVKLDPPPVPWQDPVPAQDPLWLPLADPFPVPAPVPWVKPQVDPWVDPTPAPAPAVAPVPAPIAPYEVRSVDRSSSDPRAAAGSHMQVPPGPGEREKKGRVRGGIGLALADVAGKYLGESKDFIDAVYGALPRSQQRADFRENGYKRLTPQQKAKSLWDHAGDIDVAKAAENVAKNELQDRAFGWIGSRTKQAVGKAAEDGYYRGGRGLSITRVY